MSIRAADAFVALASNQLAAQVEFYRALLNIEPVPCSDRYAEFRLRGLRLAIFVPKPDNASLFAADTSGAMSLCVEIEDLENAIAHLKAIGHSLNSSIMKASHGKEIYVYDPDGNRLILHQSTRLE
ncbi:MAG: VOC family protein [Cyanobacteria bacterium J06621_11]